MPLAVRTFALLLLILPGLSLAQDWPEILDPLQLRTYRLQVTPENWEIVQNDETFEIEVPAAFAMGDEWPILVGLRRKSGDALTEAPGFRKVSLKIDINEYDDDLLWHGLNKISLENGDDQDVVTEGFAWQLHQRASGPEGYGYDPGRACWVKLYVNDEYIGVYVHAEQRDKQFLVNRGLFYEGQSWLYKMGDIGSVELKVGEGDSPTYQELCYPPFRSECSPLDPGELAATLPGLIDMRGMIALGAINAFCCNPDELFNHGKNCFFADLEQGPGRLYFPWDLDSAGSGGYTVTVPTGSPYADILLAVPEFYEIFEDVVADLLTGPLALPWQLQFLNQLEPVLTEALEADPNSKMNGDVAGHFDGLRAWVAQRFADFEPLIPDQTSAGDCAPLTGLSQNAPNPFNPWTRIEFALESDAAISLDIYDFSGRRVRRLAEGWRAAGSHQETWDGRDDRGGELPSGVYFCRLKSGSVVETRKMILLR